MDAAQLSEAEERAARAPLVPDELARRFERASVSYDVEWLEPVTRRPTSPRGLTVRRFGEAVAFAAPGAPDLDFLNRVNGLWPEEAASLPEIAAWYRGLGLRFWAEVVPLEGADALAEGLERVGAERIGFHCVLFGEAGAAGAAGRAPGGVEVREVGGDELARFTSTLLDGHGVPPAVRGELDLQSHWGDIPGWRLYLGEVEGEPAGAAVLRVGDGVGLLATASTVPRFRGRGVQTALIARRLEDAAGAGCELVTSAAAAGSISLRNLARDGLRPAFTKTVWRLGG